MKFADIHTHILWGVDDGAQNEEQTKRMLDTAYADGVRLLCLTPHYHPGYFGSNRESARENFEKLRQYAGEKYPEMQLYLANELRYSSNCVSWLDEGFCRTLGEHHVLVDFPGGESAGKIRDGLYKLLNGGYVPILAHVERYGNLRGDRKTLSRLRDQGVLLQITSGSLFGAFGLGTKVAARRLLKEDLVDLVASDAHNMDRRRPGLGQAWDYLESRFGLRRAEALCYENARQLLAEGREERER